VLTLPSMVAWMVTTQRSRCWKPVSMSTARILFVLSPARRSTLKPALFELYGRATPEVPAGSQEVAQQWIMDLDMFLH
jgi:hypothetical protein